MTFERDGFIGDSGLRAWRAPRQTPRGAPVSLGAGAQARIDVKTLLDRGLRGVPASLSAGAQARIDMETLLDRGLRTVPVSLGAGAQARSDVETLLDR